VGAGEGNFPRLPDRRLPIFKHSNANWNWMEAKELSRKACSISNGGHQFKEFGYFAFAEVFS
jgi:hypothetical protein